MRFRLDFERDSLMENARQRLFLAVSLLEHPTYPGRFMIGVSKS